MNKKSVQDKNMKVFSNEDESEYKMIGKTKYIDSSTIKAIIDCYLPLLFDIQRKSYNLKRKDLNEITLKLNLALGQVSEISELIDEIIIQEIFSEKSKSKKNLIPILQAVQSQFSYLSNLT